MPLADIVAKAAGHVRLRQREWRELQYGVERLRRLLWSAACNDLDEQNLWCVIGRVEETLFTAYALARKCHSRRSWWSLVELQDIPFQKILVEFQDSIIDVSWLLRICEYSYPESYNNYPKGLLPTIGTESLIGYLIREGIARLPNRSPDFRAAALASLVILAGDIYVYVDGKSNIQKGAVEPLLKLTQSSEVSVREGAIIALGLLGHNLNNAKLLVSLRRRRGNIRPVISVLVSVIRDDGPIEAKASAAWAISQLARHHRRDKLIHDSLAPVGQPLLTYLRHTYQIGMKSDNLSSFSGQKIALGEGNHSTLKILLAALLEIGTQLEEQDKTAMLLVGDRLGIGEADTSTLVNQLLQMAYEPFYNELLLPCIKALGCFCRQSWTHAIGPLVRLFDRVQEENVVLAALTFLIKIIQGSSYPYEDSSEFIAKGGLGYITQMVYQGHTAKKSALLLACYIAADRYNKEKELNDLIIWAHREGCLLNDDISRSALAEAAEFHTPI